MLLTITIGPELRDRVFTILTSGKTYSTMNSLGLAGDLHGILIKDGCMWHTPSNLRSWYTSLPICPDSQVRMTEGNELADVAASDLRPITNRNRFRIYTNNPINHPLHLHLHGMLGRMIIGAGLSQTNQARKRTHAGTNMGGDDDLDRGTLVKVGY